ncbi:uncharacterized protein LOC133532298 isoform X2 [Cydia pomonella]|uniref:uncharacterized protein LOC133532298 isoform X2 n=1 Tax=Cydia pomonella TaxID=82600 RepID=UPI002ADDCF56|nr:uncharacterized protein LOC133532298 isoform X2 [Cydia pomonella]XP_061726892.1 uncharacterized protein LOC133532298 isoform X2 [Cydia pomonella]
MSLADVVDEMTLRAENSGPLKVFYIDYGNTATVSISDLRPLELRWLALPMRAVACRLAGVSVSVSGAGAGVSVSGAGAVAGVSVSGAGAGAGVSVSGAGAGAGVSVSGASVSETLRGLALDRTMQAQIIARGLDEMTVKLIDADGFDVGEQLAVFAGITLQPYDVEHDEQRCVLVPA